MGVTLADGERGGAMTQDDGERAPGGEPPAGGAGATSELGDVAAGPEALLGEVSRLRRQARATRHAYWFPLVLFGLLTCASVPFYVQPTPQGAFFARGPFFPVLGGIRGQGWRDYLAYYWLGALVVGLVATGLWYRRHGRKVGLVTPSRGYLITGTVLIALGTLPWFVWWISGWHIPVLLLLPGDLVIRGTFPFVMIAVGFWVLTVAERSWGLFAATAVYTAAALLASLYDVENVLFRLGWYPVGSAWQFAELPNVLLPALVLLVAGAAAFAVQRGRRSPA